MYFVHVVWQFFNNLFDRIIHSYNSVVLYFTYNSLNENENNKNKQTIETELEFIERELNKFKGIYTNQKLLENANNNMDIDFYKINKYNEYMLDQMNTLEPLWRRRFLMMYTPRGNIIMFYDCYKRGFSYYCDQMSIPYTLLNVVAMRYVVYYQCLDLFVDNKILNSEFNESPLIALREEEDKREREQETKKFLKNNISMDIIKNAPMVKFKKYNNSIAAVSNPSTKKDGLPGKQLPNKDQPKTVKTTNEHYSVNRFVYLGKIQNFAMLQSYKSKQKAKFSFNETPTLSYKDFLASQKEKNKNIL
jgi:hypothetical protein